jgi:predicted nuclease of restriction endonuclease-like RecB superfamily
MTHNEEYSGWQDKYFKADKKRLKDLYLGEMYKTAKEASSNYLKKYCKSRGLRHLNIDDLSHDAAMYIIDQHIRKPDFKVEKLSAYIYFGVIKTLFKNKNQEIHEVPYGLLAGGKE